MGRLLIKMLIFLCKLPLVYAPLFYSSVAESEPQFISPGEVFRFQQLDASASGLLLL